MDKSSISYLTLFQSEDDYSRLKQLLGDFLQWTQIGDRLEQAWQALKRLDFSQVPKEPGKQAERAEARRLEGNQCYQKKNVKDALKCYNESILFADHDTKSKTLPLAIANRSACNFALNKHDLCAQDVDNALACGYPNDQRIKLYIRKAKSCLKLAGGGGEIASSFLDQAREAVENALNALSGQQQQETKKELLALHEQCSIARTKKKFEEQSIRAEESASSHKLGIKYTSERGRFVVAKEAIKTGEKLLAEEPYAATVYPDRAGFNCQNCLLRTKIFIPCPKCVSAIFCSLSCRDEALATYHRYECPISAFLKSLGCSQVTRLALRMISQKPFAYFQRLEASLAAPDVTQGKEGESYTAIYSLVGNNEHRWTEDHERRAVVAALLASLLRHTGYFISADDKTVLYVARLLLRNLQILQFNAHEVYEVVRQGTPLIPNKSIKVGLAIYARASYFNHSCHGSVARYFVGKTLCLRAVRRVARGEQVHENYGITFYFKGLEARQQYLEARYWFRCGCGPCMEDWPLLKERQLHRSIFLPTRLNLDKNPAFKKAKSLMDQGHAAKALKVLSSLLDEFKWTEDSKPTEEYIRVEDKMRTCITNLGSIVTIESLK